MLKGGDVAPLFCLPDENRNQVCLGDFKGRWVVLYFYPKDNTSGCTMEALDFTTYSEKFRSLNAEIIGISKDSCESHSTFKIKYGLKVILLSDKDMHVMKVYGAYGKKKMYGKEVEGTIRSTFIIDPQGIIRKTWYGVKVKGHVEEVLNSLKELVSKGE